MSPVYSPHPKKNLRHRISGVRRNYVTWPVFFSIWRQMKEDHDVSSENDQMTLGGSYQWTAPFITVDTDWQLGLPAQRKGYIELLYVARELVAGHSWWSHSKPVCPVFSVFSRPRASLPLIWWNTIHGHWRVTWVINWAFCTTKEFRLTPI